MFAMTRPEFFGTCGYEGWLAVTKAAALPLLPVGAEAHESRATRLVRIKHMGSSFILNSFSLEFEYRVPMLWCSCRCVAKCCGGPFLSGLAETLGWPGVMIFLKGPPS